MEDPEQGERNRQGGGIAHGAVATATSRSSVDMADVDEEQQVLGAHVADDVAGVLLEDSDHIKGTEQPDDREDVPSDHNGRANGMELRCSAGLPG